jgi:hypothetical protein
VCVCVRLCVRVCVCVQQEADNSECGWEHQRENERARARDRWEGRDGKTVKSTLVSSLLMFSADNFDTMLSAALLSLAMTL